MAYVLETDDGCSHIKFDYVKLICQMYTVKSIQQPMKYVSCTVGHTQQSVK